MLPSFFQSDVQLIKPGDKVGASEATLLNMLNISPFSYGLIIQQVYDHGSVYSPEVLDITEDALHKRFLEVSKPFGIYQLRLASPQIHVYKVMFLFVVTPSFLHFRV